MNRSIVLLTFLALSTAGCPMSSKEAAGRARTTVVGGSHAVDLDACITKAKETDAGDRYAVYELCADKVDARYGRDGGKL